MDSRKQIVIDIYFPILCIQLLYPQKTQTFLTTEGCKLTAFDKLYPIFLQRSCCMYMYMYTMCKTSLVILLFFTQITALYWIFFPIQTVFFKPLRWLCSIPVVEQAQQQFLNTQTGLSDTTNHLNHISSLLRCSF